MTVRVRTGIELWLDLHFVRVVVRVVVRVRVRGSAESRPGLGQGVSGCAVRR